MRNLSGAAWKALRSWGRLTVAAPATLRKVNIYIFIIMSMYYMCPGGGKRFVPAGSRPRNLCACMPKVPSSFPCPSLVGASPKPRKRSNALVLCALRAHVLACLCALLRVLRFGGGSFCVAPSFSRFFGGYPPQTPVSCLTVVFCARCGLTSSRAYVLSGGCSAGVVGRFCVWLSPRPAALRSAAFALDARPLAGCRPRPLFRLSVVLSTRVLLRINVCCCRGLRPR